MHLLLLVRPNPQPNSELRYIIEGGVGSGIERYHDSADDAETIIHTFCGEHHCTATVRVFTPRDRLWREDEVAADGTVTCTSPVWRVGRGEGKWSQHQLA